MLNEMEQQGVLAALNALGVALADHDHQWTDEERSLYGRAVSRLTS